MAIDVTKLNYVDNHWEPTIDSIENYFINESKKREIDIIEILFEERDILINEIRDLATNNKDEILYNIKLFNVSINSDLLDIDFLNLEFVNDLDLFIYNKNLDILNRVLNTDLINKLNNLKTNFYLKGYLSDEELKFKNLLLDKGEYFLYFLKTFLFKNIGVKIHVCSWINHLIEKYNIKEKYPDIFKNNGFELFDYLFKNYIVSNKGKTESLSYYYWKMLEDDFIHSEQKKFQDWVCKNYNIEPFDRIKSKDKIIKSNSRKSIERNTFYSTSVDWFRQSKNKIF